MAKEMGDECPGEYGGANYNTPFLENLEQGVMPFELTTSQPICAPKPR